MTTQHLSTLASHVIASYGHTAKSMINVYRVGGQRMIGAVGQSLQSTLARRGARLMPKLRAELITTQRKVSGYYSRSLQLTSGGADALVDTVVDLAAKGVHGIVANAERFDKATGTNALHTLSNVVLPAAKAVSKAADKIEAQAAQIERKIARAGALAKARRVARKASAQTKPARRAARNIAQVRG
jgi:hypothetical protein